MLATLLKTIYFHTANFVEARRAQLRKRRSINALEKLDDRLLDDIGLCRDESGKIVSIKTGSVSFVEDGEAEPVPVKQTRKRGRRDGHSLRHPYLLRRRL